MSETIEQFPIRTSNWTYDGKPDGGVSTGVGFTIAWQRGPLTEGRNGAFLLDVLWVCKTQLEHYQTGQFACTENAEALQHLNDAIEVLESRRSRREVAGTLGTHEPDQESGWNDGESDTVHPA